MGGQLMSCGAGTADTWTKSHNFAGTCAAHCGCGRLELCPCCTRGGLAWGESSILPASPQKYKVADSERLRSSCSRCGSKVVGDDDEACFGEVLSRPEPEEETQPPASALQPPLSLASLSSSKLPAQHVPAAGPPSVGRRRPIAALKAECRFNQGKLDKIQRLAESYSHWRPIRGDGNCYYRTVAFGALEAALAREARPASIFEAFESVSYEDSAQQCSHDKLVRQLKTLTSADQLEQWVLRDVAADEALVRACRRLVRMFLVRWADAKAPNGLTYNEIVSALDSSYATIEEYCAKVIDPMGRDAETLALDLLPRQLGVTLRLWILDRRDEVDLVWCDMPGFQMEQATSSKNDRLLVHALFKPGHYDLLYPRSAPRAPHCGTGLVARLGTV
eukprot:TRINITY_DN10264_c0_g1_i1.p1 TRINITY_DN10264_c0_g1~~TRINITY_DN10264_c0_g1_i1.p1  ORF type:complete len:391 (+),score=78.02 TRINITY_DN10264_c0_g1_i1:71-1243(+)